MEAMNHITRAIKGLKKKMDKMKARREPHWERLGYRLNLQTWVAIKEGVAKKGHCIPTMRKQAAAIRDRAGAMSHPLREMPFPVCRRLYPAWSS